MEPRGENIEEDGRIRTKKVKVYNSFVPKTIRDWNNLDKYRYAPSLSSFKASYKNGLLRSPNNLHMYELGDANIHHTRLRLGLSHLKSHYLHITW